MIRPYLISAGRTRPPPFRRAIRDGHGAIVNVPPIKPKKLHTFLHFWTTHLRQVPDAAIAYMTAHASVASYRRGTYLMLADGRWPYWNFVLEGLVAAYHYDEAGHVQVPWLVTAMDYFTGTIHAFTDKREELYIQCLQDTVVVQLPIMRIREGQQHFWAISELMNILKQRKMRREAEWRGILLHMGGEARFFAFFNAFPQLAPQLRRQDVCALLQISASTYKRAKRRYYGKRY